MTVTVTNTKDEAIGTMVPQGLWYSIAKIYWLALALIGTGTLTLSMWLSATNPANGGALNGIIFTLSYFTVWSNIVTAIVSWLLFANPARDGSKFRWIRLTGLVMITITGLIYAIVLAPTANPVGLEKVTNAGYHYIVPIMSVVGFLLFGPRPRFTIGLVPKMMLIPILWLIYTVLHGMILTRPPGKRDSGLTEPLDPQYFYPYPFMNVRDPSPLVPGIEAAGLPGVMLNIGLVIVLGLLMATIYWALDRALSLFRKPVPIAELEAAQAALTNVPVAAVVAEATAETAADPSDA